MAVKIVTDSTSDIPAEIARALDITVVPIHILFGNQSYRDGVDIPVEEFYRRLLNGPVHPTTSQPSPEDFIRVYDKLCGDADGLISIHISAKLSGTVSSANQATADKDYACPIEVVDTNQVSMALGIIVINAAKMAQKGADFATIVSRVKSMSERVKLLVLFDTLKYLARGGRIGKAKSLMGSVLNVKPILTLKEGEFVPSSQVRSRSKGIEKLVEFAASFPKLEDLCLVQSTTPDEAEQLADEMVSIFPRDRIIVARMGVGLATHGGPGLIGVIALPEG